MGPNYAEIAWEAYVKAVGGKSFEGKPLPTWDELGEVQKSGWVAAVKAARDAD